MTATCILVRRLSYICQGFDIEKLFGMHSSLSEVFYDWAMELYEAHRKLVTTFRTDLMVEHASLYAEAIFK